MGVTPLLEVYLPLLTRRGVGAWLRRQFDATGVFVDEAAVQAIFWHTGGHPYLLEWLTRCIADRYNESSASPPPSPLITLENVDVAAGNKTYISKSHDYSAALARTLQRHADENVRFLLYLLAAVKVDRQQFLSAAELAAMADEQFHPIPLDVIVSLLANWLALEVVDGSEQAGVTSYILRSYSFALWLDLQWFSV